MGHEIDLKNTSIHTDLALESVGEEYEKQEFTNQNCKITKIKLKEDFESKKKGTYITIEFEDVTDHENEKQVCEVFSLELKKFLEELKIKEQDEILVVGLGNKKSTPDSLGPLTLSNVLVTHHLFSLGAVEEGFRDVSIFSPGVTGETGLETSELVESVIKKFQPNLLVVVDALAARSIERVGHTIQITDTGILPGSGIGNKRKELSKEVFHIPVVAIGIPTVVDAVTIVSDTIGYLYKHFSYMKKHIHNPINKLIPVGSINYLKEEIKEESKEKEKLLGLVGTLNESEIKSLMYEVLSPIGYNLMVTPKEIDFLMGTLSRILGNGMNQTFHKKVN